MPISERIVRFLIAGGLATIVQYVLLIALVEGLQWSVIPASAMAYTISALVNYGINYFFTYKSEQNHAIALFRFGVVAVSGLSLNSFFIYVFTRLLDWYYLWAQVVSTGLVLIWNFSLNSLWSFRVTLPNPDSTGGRQT